MRFYGVWPPGHTFYIYWEVETMKRVISLHSAISMKRAVICFLIAAMCFFLCGLTICAAAAEQDTAPKPITEDDVVGEWINTADGQGIIVFDEDGTGMYDYFIVSSIPRSFSWSLDGDTLSFIYPQKTLTYKVDQNNGTLELDWSSGIYIPIEDYVEQATVITNTGEEEQLLGRDLITALRENQLRFEHNYVGAEVTVISTVTGVEGETTLNGRYYESAVSLAGAWFVETSKNEPLLYELNVGDTVKVTGHLRDGFLEKLWISDSTIELWTEEADPISSTQPDTK